MAVIGSTVHFHLSRPSYLAAASLFTRRDKAAGRLGGVYIEPAQPGGVYLVATDGHRLVVFLDPGGQTDGPVIVPVSRALFMATKFGAKAPSRKRTGPRAAPESPRLEVADGLLRVFDGYGPEPSHTEAFAPIDGDYPDWRWFVHRTQPSILETPKPDDIPAFDAAYLGAFGALLRVAYGPTRGAIRIFGGKDKPALVRSGEADWFGALMPMHGEISDGLPFPIPYPDADQPGEAA